MWNYIAQRREACPRSPVILITDSLTADLATWALRQRVWNVFGQPVSSAQLVQCIEHCMKVDPDDLDRFARPLLCPASRNVPREFETKTASALELIRKNYREDISLDAAAESCGLSSFYFCRVFKREHGENFRDYLQRHRIEKAKDLLQRRGVSVADVCFSVGFNDASYFSRTFKLYVGMTPTEFVRSLSGGEWRPQQPA